jgi:hypothetical protein
MNENRPILMKEQPELKFGDVTKVLSDKWNLLDTKSRKPYEDKVAKDRERYLKEKAEFDKKKQEEAGPKRAISAYFYFTNDKDKRAPFNAKYPDLSYFEVNKKMTEEWNKLSDDDKKPFEDLAAKDKERYKAEKAIFDKKNEAKVKAKQAEE